MPSSVNINGVVYSGRNIQVNGGRVMIDGHDYTPDSKIINIEVNGNIGELKVDACAKLTVVGRVDKLSTMSGDVNCGEVGGNVKTMSGDVHCGSVAGGVETMSGDVHRR
jgi:predicted ThiF/HesA family dinucleotide-utilizing enzyme